MGHCPPPGRKRKLPGAQLGRNIWQIWLFFYPRTNKIADFSFIHSHTKIAKRNFLYTFKVARTSSYNLFKITRSLFCLLKGTVSRDFRLFFLLKKIQPGHHMNRQKRLWEIFRFQGDIRLQSSKIRCPHTRWLCGHPIFSLDMEIFIFLNYCYWMCKHI